ncbi:hypothetical protein DRW03_33950 [Corallococcus sp. H22C18031201]|nr:hypothetical protein DRW03_33950 [Corallococcus sp. H22C18031201]
MPAEVLVMCRACRRPQPEGPPRCVFCGEPLPEAPRSTVEVRLDLGRGRGLFAGPEQLSFQGRPDGPPATVPWARVRRLEWERRPYLEALGLLAFAALGLWAPTRDMKVMGLVAGVMGVLLAGLYRHRALTLDVTGGARLRWPLGMALRGSARQARLEAAWGALAAMARERGVTVVPTAQEEPERPRA